MIALANLGIAAALAVVALGLQFQPVLLGKITICVITLVNMSDLILPRLLPHRKIPSVSPLLDSPVFEFGTAIFALGVALFCAL